jgi:hypothetical protein
MIYYIVTNCRAWLRIFHCYIFNVFTIPEVITLVRTNHFRVAAVVEALGSPRNLTVSPNILRY